VFNYVFFLLHILIAILYIIIVMLCTLVVMYVLFCVFCFIVLFCVLFVCLPPGVNPITVNKYIISYISYPKTCCAVGKYRILNFDLMCD